MIDSKERHWQQLVALLSQNKISKALVENVVGTE